ncbi:hypothetical protein XENTR_v10004945 [Xenopus tropicalis]|nr:hypothetical protein XENTR_v10004945 [Xenopus tropicalis]
MHKSTSGHGRYSPWNNELSAGITDSYYTYFFANFSVKRNRTDWLISIRDTIQSTEEAKVMKTCVLAISNKPYLAQHGESRVIQQPLLYCTADWQCLCADESHIADMYGLRRHYNDLVNILIHSPFTFGALHLLADLL